MPLIPDLNQALRSLENSASRLASTADPPGDPPLSELAGRVAGFFDNSMFKQLFVWQVLGGAVSAGISPLINEISSISNGLFPRAPLSPAELASAVVRGFRTEGDAQPIAAASGIKPEYFHTLVQLSGLAPSPDFLAEALRRGFIPDDSGSPDIPGFIQGIREGNLADKWAKTVKEMATRLPSPVQALDALLKGQTDEGTAKSLYEKFGGDPTYFDLVFNTQGGAPTPLEAAQMANRGVIPWTGKGANVVSYEQAFLEGPWRNKWLEPFRKVSEYIPTPVEIGSMLNQGVISHDQAVTWLKAHGMAEATAAAFIAHGAATKNTKQKELAESTVVKLYYDQIIDDKTATGFLEALRYSAEEAAFILEISDMSRIEANINNAITRIRTLYINRKIDTAETNNTLNRLGIPAGQVASLINVWALERGANVKTLTQGEITQAFHLTIISQDEAINELQHLGYQPHDAWLLLSIKEKAPLPNEPPRGSVSPLVTL